MTNPPTGIQPRRPRPALKKVPQFVRSYRRVRPKRHAVDDPNPKPVAANCALNSRSGASRLTMSRAREQVAVAVLLLLLYRPHNTCAVAYVSFRTQVCSLKGSGWSTSSRPNLLSEAGRVSRVHGDASRPKNPSENRQLNK